ncbi:GNAT family N-acetyltransferase [Variovorax sp. IB41]|uniref:GNAT family N-acetyltransferase n=1 Tax=Variovorax sp. IB41 TaxID=2779370 RepID=UPI0018E81CFE|nr:GNAT family N-acetyltransferase [Variovorax sp. IB41]MBJ2157819.1 GNAT family N-acetyltransferase [Variovorax sp. IB41]
MNIEKAQPSEAATVAAVLNEAAQWLATEGRPLWSATDIGIERIQRDTDAGCYFIARENGDVAGVVRIDMEDPFFWPEIEAGSSAFVHKLAVRRSWGGKGVSATLLTFAREHARSLGRPYLRLDCVADRQALRTLYEGFGFVLHSVIQKENGSFARYEMRIDG